MADRQRFVQSSQRRFLFGRTRVRHQSATGVREQDGGGKDGMLLVLRKPLGDLGLCEGYGRLQEEHRSGALLTIP